MGHGASVLSHRNYLNPLVPRRQGPLRASATWIWTQTPRPYSVVFFIWARDTGEVLVSRILGRPVDRDWIVAVGVCRAVAPWLGAALGGGLEAD